MSLGSWYLIGYHHLVNPAELLRQARRRSGLTLRALAQRAHTSHSALAAYESGRKTPAIETLERIMRAAGYEPGLQLVPALTGIDPAARGRELIEVLELAAMFPARTEATLSFPYFGRP